MGEFRDAFERGGRAAEGQAAPTPGGSFRERFEAAQAAQAPEELNVLEKGAAAVADVPILSGLLQRLGGAANIGLKVASATNPLLSGALTGGPGTSEERTARSRERLGQIPGDLGTLVTGGVPEDFLDPGTVLTEAGVPETDLGRVDIPGLGPFTGRGLAKFGLGVGTDPLVFTRLGSAAVTPRAARLAGRTSSPILRRVMEGAKGRPPSTLEMLARTGERSAATLGGVPLFGRKASTAILKPVGEVSAFLRRTIFKPFVSKTGTIIDSITPKAASRVAAEIDAEAARFANIRPEIVRDAEARFKANPEEFGTLDNAVQRSMDEIAEIAERKSSVALQPGQRGTVMARFREFRNEGLSRSEAAFAAKAVVIDGMDSTFSVYAARTNKFMRRLKDLELDTGGMLQTLDSPGQHYLLHWVKPELKHLMGAGGRFKFIKRVNEWYAGNKSQVRRKAMFRGKSIAGMNEWARETIPGVKALHEEWVKQGRKGVNPSNLFETDPVRLAAERAQRLKKTATAAEAHLDFGKSFGRRTTPELLEEGYVPMTDILREHRLRTRRGPRGAVDEGTPGGFGPDPLGPRGIPTKLQPLEGLVVHPEIAGAMRQTMQRYAAPQAPGTMLKIIDEVTRLWKTGVTVLWPEFHARNAVSNFWANYLGDVTNPAVYAIAFKVMRDFGKGLNETYTFGAKTFTTNQIIRAMENANALGYGSTFVAETVGNILKSDRLEGTGGIFSTFGAQPLKGRFGAPGAVVREGLPSAALVAETGNPLALLFGPRTGRNLGNVLESHAKVAHVVDKLRKGMDLDGAILSAKKYLFDYSDLTNFERVWLRRLVPFYTWFRKNTPLQLETLFTKPGKIAVLRHAQVALEDDLGGPVDTTVVPKWIRQRWFTARKNDDGSVESLSGLGFGTEDLSFFDRPFLNFLSMLNPMLKAPLQAGFERDFFRDIPLERARIAPRVLRHLPDAFLNHINYMEVKDRRTGEVRFAEANPNWLNFIRGFPGTGALSRFANSAERLAQNENPRPGDFDPNVKHFTGIKRNVLTPTRQAINLLVLEREQIRERLSELVREGAARRTDVVFRRKELVGDPRLSEVRSDNRQIGRIQKLLRRLYAQENKSLLEPATNLELRGGRSSLGR